MRHGIIQQRKRSFAIISIAYSKSLHSVSWGEVTQSVNRFMQRMTSSHIYSQIMRLAMCFCYKTWPLLARLKLLCLSRSVPTTSNVPAGILHSKGSRRLTESPSLCECEVREGLTTDLRAGLLKAYLQLEMSGTDYSLPCSPQLGTAFRKPGRLWGTVRDQLNIPYHANRSGAAAELHRGRERTLL